MGSVEQICGEALGYLGLDPIEDINSTDVKATRCRQFFEPARDALLRRHSWNFATERKRLERDKDAPAFGYLYAYTLPSDYIEKQVVATNLTDVDSPEITTPEIVHRVESGKILCNEEELYLKYTSRVTETGRFDPLFSECLALILAARLAGPLTGSAPKGMELLKLAEHYLARATSANAREGGTASRQVSSSWIDARR